MSKLGKNIFSSLRSRRFTILAVYGVFALVFFIVFGRSFLNHLESPTWFIAPIMAFGSFVAGATFLGGGSVAFPALTKLLTVDPITAKTFSLAIQSVGMSSAAIYIISRVRNLPLSFITLYVTGSAIGIGLSLSTFEAVVPAIDLRISFTLFLLCFLVVYLFTRQSSNTSIDTKLEKSSRDIALTLSCGIIGGIVSGLLGSGADLIGFSLLALYFRVEIKRATQISVILMAATAIIGTGLQGLIFNRINEDVLSLWYVAAPVVIFGAPVGAAFCRRISPKILIIFICSIVFVELVTTLYLVPIDKNRLIYYGFAAVASIGLLFLFRQQARIKHD